MFSRIISLEKFTSKCHGAKGTGWKDCHEAGGKWIPAVDISGHCFLLIFNILVLCEEVSLYT